MAVASMHLGVWCSMLMPSYYLFHVNSTKLISWEKIIKMFQLILSSEVQQIDLLFGWLVE